MNSSSSESDLSDMEWAEMLTTNAMRRKKTIQVRPNHFNSLDDAAFYNRFRMSKASAYCILQLIGPHIEHPTNWNAAVSAEVMLLTTLRFYATGGFFITVGELHGLSKATTSKIVAKVSKHIALLRPQFISLPTSCDERSQLSKEFYKIAKFPRTIAALDCTHIKILSPGGNDAELYRNRKGFFSINVQTTCDANLKITSIVARWPGSAHDSNILHNSRLFSRIEDGEFGDSIIVADSGYKNTKNIVTPVLNPIKPEEILFNESLIRTRCLVERSYGIWKRRFPVLSIGIRLNFIKTQSVIVATAVLHNICCLNNEMQPPPLSNDIEQAVVGNLAVPPNRTAANSLGSSSTRSQLINFYFKNLL